MIEPFFIKWYTSANSSLGRKVKGFPEDSINFVKLGDRLSEAITASECLIVAFIILS
jgi:hypothetical protein